MANRLVFLQLMHGASYADLASGAHFTTTDPVKGVSEAHAKRLLRETVPQYTGSEPRGAARRFKAVPAPAAPPPPADDEPPVDESTEPTEDEVEAQIHAAQTSIARTPVAAPASVPDAASVTSGEGGPASPVKARSRLPRTPDTDGSASSAG